jgi:hypothetical protein
MQVGIQPSLDSDVNPATGRTNVLSLSWGQYDDSIDGGVYLQDSEIGDFVWLDLDGNGVQSAGEPGLSGVSIELWDAFGFSQGTLTDSAGQYSFTVAPGTWRIRVLAPQGYTFTVPFSGTDPNLESIGGPMAWKDKLVSRLEQKNAA